jgi:hypothetical protein
MERGVHGRAHGRFGAADDSTDEAAIRRREAGGKDQASFGDSAPVDSR